MKKKMKSINKNLRYYYQCYKNCKEFQNHDVEFYGEYLV